MSFDIGERLRVIRERVGRNPRTGEEIRIPPSATVTFQPGRTLKGHTAAANARGTLVETPD